MAKLPPSKGKQHSLQMKIVGLGVIFLGGSTGGTLRGAKLNVNMPAAPELFVQSHFQQ